MLVTRGLVVALCSVALVPAGCGGAVRGFEQEADAGAQLYPGPGPSGRASGERGGATAAGGNGGVKPPGGSGGTSSGGAGSGGAWAPNECAWGDLVICRCTDLIYGGMTCLLDRSGYGPCVCQSCSDGIKNQTETDIDCGGRSSCPSCPIGALCGSQGDCESNSCHHPRGRCGDPTCTDGGANGSETDVDCGGGACPPCGSCLLCAADADCASGTCDAGLCLGPPSTDGGRCG